MSRDKYIIVFHDITQANPDWGSLYKAYLPAESLLSAELLAKSVKGMVCVQCWSAIKKEEV